MFACFCMIALIEVAYVNCEYMMMMMMMMSYCFQRVLAIAILSVCLSVCASVCHTGGSVKNGAS